VFDNHPLDNNRLVVDNRSLVKNRFLADSQLLVSNQSLERSITGSQALSARSSPDQRSFSGPHLTFTQGGVVRIKCNLLATHLP
jgi:hypothetical protein